MHRTLPARAAPAASCARTGSSWSGTSERRGARRRQRRRPDDRVPDEGRKLHLEDVRLAARPADCSAAASTAAPSPCQVAAGRRGLRHPPPRRRRARAGADPALGRAARQAAAQEGRRHLQDGPLADAGPGGHPGRRGRPGGPGRRGGGGHRGDEDAEHHPRRARRAWSRRSTPRPATASPPTRCWSSSLRARACGQAGSVVLSGGRPAPRRPARQAFQAPRATTMSAAPPAIPAIA